MIHTASLDELSLQNSWLTIGVFDGVHRGHQQIIRRLTAGAQGPAAPAVVVTFSPHPASVLGRGEVKCLTTSDERADLLARLGVDVVVTLTFDHDLAETSAQDFVERLRRPLDFRHLLIGYDFALGKGREGNAARLTQLGAKLGFAVEVIPAVGDESGVISSTEIRKLVETGEVGEAANLLGHPYSLHGPVIHGDRRGRELGFPTANIEYPAAKILPSNGIYACRANVGARTLQAAVNIGVRPQFESHGHKPMVEAYLLDFQGDLYGQDVRLDFVARLRDEGRFASVEALVEQMHVDVKRTRELLASR
jgi:riboflavin kinase/FMN adenylyltransferase